ncbi:Co2+/Mg2+ efflux protein ApaG [Maricaulis sp.]|uniref:Co2+/Mg2+ efflux protein ApaG n=1 Tax=Maricaulis sp. TaxID=1486257 RepID=UPI002605D3DF|nr:Co2+/Mg2+ efflux protein ApaG [Maricaulis sp.]
MYEHDTDGVMVRVEPDYLEEESSPDDGRFVWSYTIEIENHTDQPVQLVSRKWVITDSMGRTEHVQGRGVVGEQPVIQPGERFRYTSGAPLRTASGFMQGSYEMRRQSGEVFAALIPGFSLDRPDDRASLH